LWLFNLLWIWSQPALGGAGKILQVSQGQIDSQWIFAGLGVISLIVCVTILVVLARKLHRAQMSLAALNAKLEGQVRERMVALAQANIQLEQEVAVRVKAEELLLESEARYRFLAENISDVIWLIDLTSRQILYLSSSVTLLTGYIPDEIIEHVANGTLYANLIRDILDRIDQAISENLPDPGGMQFQIEDLEVPCKDKSKIWVETLVRCHLNETNQHIELLGVSRNITIRKQAEEDLNHYTHQLEYQQAQLRQQVTRDPLTGAFNRRYFEETLVLEVSCAVQNHEPLSLVMIDVDHFKRINDTLGHLAGDYVLRELVKYLKKNMREGDIFCRYGGEEFVVILPKAPLDVAVRRAEDWRQALSAYAIVYNGREVKTAVSMGISALQEMDTTGELLFAQADQALYRAKKAGRNCIMTQEVLPVASTRSAEA